MTDNQEYSDYYEEEEDSDEFDKYDDFEYDAKTKHCAKSNAGIKSCVKKVKGGIAGCANAMKK